MIHVTARVSSPAEVVQGRRVSIPAYRFATETRTITLPASDRVTTKKAAKRK